MTCHGTHDLRAYYLFIEKLRDSDLFARGLIRLHDITISIPDGYREYENDLACQHPEGPDH